MISTAFSVVALDYDKFSAKRKEDFAPLDVRDAAHNLIYNARL
ncbi:hypothetical protein [Leminorella grimontii]